MIRKMSWTDMGEHNWLPSGPHDDFDEYDIFCDGCSRIQCNCEEQDEAEFDDEYFDAMDFDPEDFGLEDLGSIQHVNALIRERNQLRDEGYTFGSGTNYHWNRKCYDRDNGWKSQTRCCKQWERRVDRSEHRCQVMGRPSLIPIKHGSIRQLDESFDRLIAAELRAQDEEYNRQLEWEEANEDIRTWNRVACPCCDRYEYPIMSGVDPDEAKRHDREYHRSLREMEEQESRYDFEPFYIQSQSEVAWDRVLGCDVDMYWDPYDDYWYGSSDYDEYDDPSDHYVMSAEDRDRYYDYVEFDYDRVAWGHLEIHHFEEGGEIEVFIADDGPEDFGFEDFGTVQHANAAYQWANPGRRYRSVTPKSTGATRHSDHHGGGTGWKRTTRCHKQWERHGRFSVPVQGALRPKYSLELSREARWDMSPEACRREEMRLQKIRQDAEREKQRQSDLFCEWIRDLHNTPHPTPVFEGMSPSEAERYEREFRSDMGAGPIQDYDSLAYAEWCLQEEPLDLSGLGPEDFGLDPNPRTKMGTRAGNGGQPQDRGYKGPQRYRHKPPHKEQVGHRKAG